ncbi:MULTISPECIES: alpha/beta hydrolase [Rhodopseudomonas]|uniref:Palmitoyl-protein thioesterase ABHD10, mitochondrial n=1 Tax=Rhodopseudomonas palustris TaxID=1076 RepID=A0A0D7F320_RHOPL|nr:MULTISPECIES: alpha/beta hydrolase [Rhodopseudomonas]KIZ47488.1 alpha/beta hydrolase [Rhodopseudomonas palustris]MDF3808717.1 alpha/beta hydrolase [Rhodopseudomonas sp. BAL398]WOK16247.1 alpha/beta hydrolase [Rhodopseudomonas sp. BAL398]
MTNPSSGFTGQSPTFIAVGNGSDQRAIAVRARPGSSPGLLWLGGFLSDMKGTKAAALDQWAAESGRACVRFDYSGHGESGGAFADGTIGRWLEDSLAVFESCCEGPQIVVGSSMGGWIALLLARELARRGAKRASLAALVLIAPAADFTEELMWKAFPPQIRTQIETTGVWLRPSDYGEPYPITRALIEDGRKHLVLGGAISLGCPVRILQGTQDPDVPWRHAFALTDRLPSDDVVLTLIQDGDHRLSRPQDIARIIAAVQEFA